MIKDLSLTGLTFVNPALICSSGLERADPLIIYMCTANVVLNVKFLELFFKSHKSQLTNLYDDIVLNCIMPNT